MKVFASFVTYNPEPERFKAAMKSIESQVDKVIVVDNTDNNEGIACALNKAFEQAEADGCDYLITFDQDSIAPDGLVKRLLDDIAGIENVGQIGPAHSKAQFSSEGVVDAEQIITSGSLTSVSAWRVAGGFRNDFFIDCVDIEFSLRLRKSNYKVLLDTGVLLNHELGYGFMGWNIFGKKRLGFFDHTPIRWYYIVRNSLYLNKEYRKDFPEMVSEQLRTLFRSVFRMLVNGSGRSERLEMVLKGISDYRKGVTGELKQK